MLWKTILLLFLGICHCSHQQTTNHSEPLVSSSLGQYRGSLMKTSLFDKPIYSFKGIKYAEPPVNHLRFQPPIPVKKHEGVYDATNDGPSCPQKTQDPVSEDCLSLNVYTTKLPDTAQNPKRPVIITIHPFSSRSDRAGPQYLLNQEIVLVVINYRLGVLGFLSTGDNEAPGNNGLKDQVAAIKWVQQNIEGFGGDPNTITLIGHGHTGISVSLHLVSPLSKGLFQRAVMSSGSILELLSLGNDQLDLAKRQAAAVGCPTSSSVNIVNCLKNKSVDVLINSESKLNDFGEYPLILWQPVIEKNFGQERFLTDHPIKLISEGKFENVPVVTGIVAEEYADKAIELSENETQLNHLDQRWNEYAPIIFKYERNTPRSKKISEDLRHFYFGEKNIDKLAQLPLIHIMDDGIVGFGVDRTIKLLSIKNSQYVYYYRFSYRGKYSYHQQGDNKGNFPYRPLRFDDMIYFYYDSILFPEFKRTDVDFHTVDRLTTSLNYFAKTGNPLPTTCGKFDYTKWLPYNVKTQKFLDMNETVTLQEKLHTERYAEWEKLFPISEVH